MLYHRYLMEIYLKRELNKDEIVHHKDGNKTNNKIENLIVLNRSSHMAIHYAVSTNDFWDEIFTAIENKKYLHF